MITYFIADLHLNEDRPDITACFLSFLKNEATKAEKLYILGDLFEYWVGDDDDDIFVKNIASALKTLSNTGTHLYFIHGNRDFLLGERYAKKAGITLLPESAVIDLYGEKTLIMHGDTLCTDDVDYQKFRRKSHTWWWQFMIKSLPLSLRKKIANNYRQKSSLAKQNKSLDIMDVNQNEVTKKLIETNTLRLIHGHTHRPNTHNFKVNNQPAQRIVLGNWGNKSAWLAVTPASITEITKTL